ncbi:MAG: hypothetical protein A2Y41_00025 [Spirochaetes bacterium GWB1_36_13]|nr:MAG: hypothetical protein A2Y41_00025 [Spirochaetes bacterium GWB1_36_13]
MSGLKDIVIEEKERLEKLIIFYNQEILKYPKGYISKKMRNGNIYYYNSFREGKKVKSVYIGKVESPELKEFEKQIDKRKDLEKKLNTTKKNLKEAGKMLNG